MVVQIPPANAAERELEVLGIFADAPGDTDPRPVRPSQKWVQKEASKEATKEPLVEDKTPELAAVAAPVPLVGHDANPDEDQARKEQLLWEDAQDSLPLIGAGCEEDTLCREGTGLERGPEECLEGSSASSGDLSPSGSSEASSDESRQVLVGGEKYIQISLSAQSRNEAWRLGGAANLPRDTSGWSSSECMPEGSTRQSYTGPNSRMQMVPRAHKSASEGVSLHSDGPVPRSPRVPDELVTAAPTEQIHTEAEAELQVATVGPDPEAMAKIRAFCARIVKTLAPPLLREIESSKLNAQAEPFTPKRVTRRTVKAGVQASSTAVKQASAAETVLLKALGITPADLSASEEDLAALQQLFDSPVREQHLRAVAAIFGKVLPSSFERSDEVLATVQVA
jgi:hypothetical protein